MSHPPYIDPVAAAWRHCNPHVPLPSVLLPRTAPSGLALSLHSSHGPLVADSAEPSQDIQAGLLTVATLPRISPSDERVMVGPIAE
jgi:hypothetical protein